MLPLVVKNKTKMGFLHLNLLLGINYNYIQINKDQCHRKNLISN